MNSLFAVILGVLLGYLLCIVSYGYIFFLAISAIIAYLLYRQAQEREKSFIVWLFLSGLLLRLFFVILTVVLVSWLGFGPQSVSFPGLEGLSIVGDEVGIHQRAWALANTLKGARLPEIQAKSLLNFGQYGWSLQVNILGFLYYLFGIVPVLGKCLNSLFGVLTGILVYFTTKKLFGIKTAKLAGILTVFFPTLFFWSITNLKDSIFIFILTFVAFSFTSFLKTRKVKYLLLLALLLPLIALYRTGIIALLIIPMLVCALVNKKWLFAKVVVIFILSLTLLFNSQAHNYLLKKIREKDNFSNIVMRQKANGDSAESAYVIYPERFYNYHRYENVYPITVNELIPSFTKGFTFLMFKPFPWDIDNKAKLAFYPIAVLWLVLFPFFIIGLFFSFRKEYGSSIFLILLFLSIAIMLSLTEGNIGTMVRHRDMLTPIYLIYSSLGLIRMSSGSKELQIENNCGAL
jgi:hypothetical protein